MKTSRTYVFMFLPIYVDRGAHASRVRAMASSPSRTFRDALIVPNVFESGKACCGEAPQPTRETHALPSHLFWTWFVDNPHPSAKSS
jgi:hypothetical protein